MVSMEIANTGNVTAEQCNCLPTCTNIEYEIIENHKILSLELIDKKVELIHR